MLGSGKNGVVHELPEFGMLKGGLLRRYHSWFVMGQRLADAVVVFALMPVLCSLGSIHSTQPYQVTAMLGALLTWMSMGAVDAYRPWRGTGFWREARTILAGWGLVVCLLLLIGWLLKFTGTYSRMVIGMWFVMSPVAMMGLHLGARMVLRYWRRRGGNTRTAVVVGAGDLGRDVARRILAADWMGLRLLGFFDDDAWKQGGEVLGLPVLGTGTDVADFVRDNAVDHVYLALPLRAESRMRQVFDALQDTTASVYLIPDLFIFELLGAREQEVAGLPAFALCETPVSGPFGVIKRIEDVVLATLILALIWPLMLTIALGVKFSSPGPVLFRQRRYGLNGREIVVWKFRSMRVCEDGDHVPQARRRDPRVTPFGRFLRRTSLDELPQFINVLQGRMSVVGPRPHAVAHNEHYRKLIRGYMWRHKVKPGITGWAQVNGWRGETDTLDKMKKRVEYDLEYIRNWSVWLDLKIVALTVLRGFGSRNAY